MGKILSIILFSVLLFSIEHTSIMVKSENGFIMKPVTPYTPKVCANVPVEQTSTGFLFTGRIVWGDPAVNAEPGDPYVDSLVFVSEGKTRAWEYVGKTNADGNFSIPIKPYTQFKLYAWDGSSKFFAMYDGHFYYNSELHNLYQTPTGEEPKIADEGDAVVVEVNN